jgi:heptosyltransferase I
LIPDFPKGKSVNMLPLQNPPARICILRLSALGDVTHVLPVIRAIHSRWPQTEITWIIGKMEYRLLRRLDGIEFIVFDKQGGLAEVSMLRQQLKGRRFDVLMHMQVALRANILSRIVDAPIRLGWNRERSRDRHHWFVNHPVDHVPFQHQVPGFLEFARALGVPFSDPVWGLPVTDEDREWAAQVLPSDRPVLMISPCSSHQLRNWSATGHARVADHAIGSLGMNVVLTGGPSVLERSTGAAIEAAMNHTAVNLIGKDTLTQSMALLENAAVLITPDSGPSHLASALGTPVLGLHAATWSRRSGPYNSLELCVDRFPDAARKFRHKEPEELRWGTRIEVPGVMDLIQPGDVIEKLESLAARA